MPENPRLTDLIGRQVCIRIATPPAAAVRFGAIVDVTGDWLSVSHGVDIVLVNAAHVYSIEVLSTTEEK